MKPNPPPTFAPPLPTTRQEIAYTDGWRDWCAGVVNVRHLHSTHYMLGQQHAEQLEGARREREEARKADQVCSGNGGGTRLGCGKAGDVRRFDVAEYR